MAWSKVSRHVRGYGTAWDKLRLRILERDCYLCQSCRRGGRIKVGNQVHHIVSKAKGGSDDPSNLEVICEPCHEVATLADTGRQRKPVVGVDGWPVEDAR